MLTPNFFHTQIFSNNDGNNVYLITHNITMYCCLVQLMKYLLNNNENWNGGIEMKKLFTHLIEGGKKNVIHESHIK